MTMTNAARSVVVVFVLTVMFAGAVNAIAARALSPLGWGFEVGRADEGDVAALLADQMAVRRSMDRIERFSQGELAKQRVSSILGLDDSNSLTIFQLMEKMEKWWEKEIDEPLKRIANNPAASCDEAREVLRLLLGRERQRALLNLSTGSYDYILEVFSDVSKRCHEEALDECNSTGRWDHFRAMVAGERRQANLLGLTADDSWLVPALQECAIYELHYVSTTDINDAFKLHSIIDGRIKIKPTLEGEDAFAILENLSFEGEVQKGTNPFLQKLDCSLEGMSVTCSPGGDPKKSAWAKINKLTLKSKEFYVENSVSKQRPVGEDLLELTFSPAMISATAVVKVPEAPPMPLPFLEVGGTGFYIAHRKSEIEPVKFKFTESTRSGYPILFEFTRKASDVVGGIAASDSTVFQLIHKPEKKPFPPKESKPRKPLKPKQ